MADSIEYVGPSDFVHLHCHSILSFLDGVATPEQYASECHKRGWSAMALTEHGHMASVPDLYHSFKKYNLKPIFGCEIYYNDWEPERQKIESKGIKVRSPKWRKENVELASRISRNRHLTVICKNETGFHNLIKLTTQAYETGLFGVGVKQFNRIWFDKLCEFKEGLIILSGCLNGPICHELRTIDITTRDGEVVRTRTSKERLDEAVKYVKKFHKEFGEDYYIELQMPGVEGDLEVFQMLIQLADKFKIKTVLANDSHYMTRDDYNVQKIMMAIAQGVTVDSPDLFHVNSDEQFFKTRAELWDRYVSAGYNKGFDNKVFEDMCDNTLEVADKCQKIIIDGSPKIPIITNADEELRILVATRLKQLGFHNSKEKFPIDGRMVSYVEQAKIELDRFIDKGLSSYFLITRNLIQYGKANGWPFGPRGCSIPSSLITMADFSQKPICDVSVGSCVLDGFGTQQIVENKFVYDVAEEMIVIELDDNNKVTVTVDHKLYIIRDEVVMLVTAGSIKDTDEIISTNWDQKNNHEDNQSII